METKRAAIVPNIDNIKNIHHIIFLNFNCPYQCAPTIFDIDIVIDSLLTYNL